MEYGLIGKSLPHSYSKIIHNKIGDYEYELYPIQEDAVGAFMTAADFKAINVTIPYKQTVIPYLYEMSEAAKSIGSVNTIVNKNGRLYGYNTDYAGFKYMTDRAGIGFCDAKVVILGSGGTSLTAQAVAKDFGAREVVVVSRGGFDNYDNISRHSDADVLINTTPVGMYPGNGVSPLDIGIFSNLKGVVDVIYNPLKTKLILDATKLGIPCTGGLSMLVSQAVFASEFFFDTKYDKALTECVLSEMERETANLVLVGMPGSGKSTLGRLLADKLGREFIDMDEYIERQHNCSIPDIFSKYGEEGFRAMERDTAGIIGKLKGLVISTGGGVVLSEDNYQSLKQNGTVIFVKRSLDQLATDGRPLSKSRDALVQIYNKRIGLYEKWADLTISNDKTPDMIADEMLQLCYKG